MYLRLPKSNEIVEISKGAARLETPEGAATQGYYTYETLAAIIAGINSRLAALGSKDLTLPTTLNVSSTEHILVPDLSDEIVNSNENVIVDENVVPSVQDLAAAIDENAGDISILREDLTTLTNEVLYEDIEGYVNSRLDAIDSELKNRNALTIQGNGTQIGDTYDGSEARIINITPSNIGAAPAYKSGTADPRTDTTITLAEGQLYLQLKES
jgi:hypothetical protein